MAARTHPDETLFEDGPAMSLQRWLGLVERHQLHVIRRAFVVVMVGWVPLVVLTLAQVALRGGDGIDSLLMETGAHARYLVCAPLLIVAEAQCAAYLGMAVHQFVDAGLIPDGKRKQFEAAVNSTRSLLGSRPVEIAVFALAYLVTLIAVFMYAHEALPSWHRSAGIFPLYSAAGWWHLLVSMPLLLILILGWFWRLALWARLLVLVSRIDLKLVASHPDRSAGLSFLGHSLRAFSIVAFALVAIAAGRSAHFVLAGSTLPTQNLFFNAGLVLFLLALFTAPLFAFVPTLARTWRRGSIEYGALAGRIGDAFEHRWLERSGKVERGAFEKPDFSATADLYAVASNVYAMRFVPVDLKDLISLAVAMALPFVPVLLLAVPAGEVWEQLMKLLF